MEEKPRVLMRGSRFLFGICLEKRRGPESTESTERKQGKKRRAKREEEKKRWKRVEPRNRGAAVGRKEYN
jgi:hypothetical protein